MFALPSDAVAEVTDVKKALNQVSQINQTSLIEEKILPWAWADKLAKQGLNKLGADGDFEPDKAIDWGYVPNPIYSTEKKFGLGLVVFGLFIADEESRRATLGKPSQIIFKTYATTNGSKGVEANLRSLFRGDKYRLNVDAEWADTPEVFYGLSFALNEVESNKLIYDHQGENFQTHGLKRLFGDTFVGLGAKYHNNKAEDSRGPGSAFASELVDSASVGVSGHLLYDSRDHQDNPSSGSFIQLDYTKFSESLGSDTEFEQLAWSFSSYIKVQPFYSRLPATLAWQVQGLFSEGAVPWDRLALLGGSRQLRGYEQGRYRGRQKVLAQIELRQQIVGRHGIVTWAGIGTLSDDLSALGQKRWLPSAGFGYRLRLKEKMNLRFDIGFGKSDSGVYVGVKEVF
jgi:hypothetical protein